MSRRQRYGDEEILKVAAEVFLEHGPTAGTALIARRAGVSEGILFKRFKSKEALFEAALTLGMESDQWRQGLIDSAGKNTPQRNLKEAILALFDKLQKLIPKLMILDGQGHHRPFPSGTKAPPLEDAAAIATYLKDEMRRGRIVLEHPELHAHEIVGAVAHCTMMRLRHEVEICSAEQWAEHLVSIHLGRMSGKKSREATPKQGRQ